MMYNRDDSMETVPRVSIIILNWNGWKDTIECLESVYQITYPNYDVIVVDNGSEDKSIEQIKKYAEGKINIESKFIKYTKKNKPIYVIEYSHEEIELRRNKDTQDIPPNKRIIIINNRNNYGFAEGNNIGINFTLNNINPEYVLLLNNDTVVQKDFLNELILNVSHNNSGILGPKILYYNFEGRADIIWSAGGYFNMWSGIRTTRHYRSVDQDDDPHPMNVDFVSGAALLIHKNVIKTIGLLDSDYFTYTEDIDWCYRAKMNGYHIQYVPSSTVWHKVSMSTGTENSAFSQYQIVRNSILFMKKNAPIWQWPTYLLISCCFLLRRIVSVDSERRKSMIRGILWHITAYNKRKDRR